MDIRLRIGLVGQSAVDVLLASLRIPGVPGCKKTDHPAHTIGHGSIGVI